MGPSTTTDTVASVLHLMRHELQNSHVPPDHIRVCAVVTQTTCRVVGSVPRALVGAQVLGGRNAARPPWDLHKTTVAFICSMTRAMQDANSKYPTAATFGMSQVRPTIYFPPTLSTHRFPFARLTQQNSPPRNSNVDDDYRSKGTALRGSRSQARDC